MQKISIYVAIILFGILIIPMSVFATQSGGGYVVQDQINNSTGVNSGNGFTNQSGGSTISSQSMSGGGFTSVGGAYRGSATPSPSVPPPSPSSSSSSGGSGFVPVANNPIVGFPLTGATPISPTNTPLVNQPEAVNQPSGESISIIDNNQSSPPATDSISGTNNIPPKSPELFDVATVPVQSKNEISDNLFITGIGFLLIGMLVLVFFIVKKTGKKPNSKYNSNGK